MFFYTSMLSPRLSRLQVRWDWVFLNQIYEESPAQVAFQITKNLFCGVTVLIFVVEVFITIAQGKGYFQCNQCSGSTTLKGGEYFTSYLASYQDNFFGSETQRAIKEHS